MAKEENRRLAPGVIAEDQQCLSNLKAVEGYQPSNGEFNVPKITEACDAMTDAQEKETQADFAWQAARQRAVATEWAFHNKILGAKKQIVAQFGEDSDKVKAVGLKKKSEYKRAGGRKPAPVVLAKAA